MPSVRAVVLDAAAAARGAAGSDERSMTHSWLFTGPPGAGRSVTAKAFAAALVCTDPDEIGCGRCQNCLDVFADRHTDVVHIVPKELVIHTEEVRRIIAQASRLPTISAWRVIIIDDADRFSQPAADAFLKTVEEPPASTVIIMCAPSTDPEDFSVTLRSRCRHVYIPAPSKSEIVRLLMAEGASESDAQLAAATSLRHVGRARRLIRDPGAQQRRAAAINLAELVFEGDQAFKAVASFVANAEKVAKTDYGESDAAELDRLATSLGVGAKGKGAAQALSGAAAAIKELEKKQKARGTRRTRDILDMALVDLAALYRDAMMISSGARVELNHPDFEPLSRELADRVGLSGLTACQDAIAICREHLDQSVLPPVAFNGLIGRLRIACNAH
ncbi:DNA polymerase III subunit delta' [Corynebacterium aquatimens]